MSPSAKRTSRPLRDFRGTVRFGSSGIRQCVLVVNSPWLVRARGRSCHGVGRGFFRDLGAASHPGTVLVLAVRRLSRSDRFAAARRCRYWPPHLMSPKGPAGDIRRLRLRPCRGSRARLLPPLSHTTRRSDGSGNLDLVRPFDACESRMIAGNSLGLSLMIPAVGSVYS